MSWEKKYLKAKNEALAQGMLEPQAVEYAFTKVKCRKGSHGEHGERAKTFFKWFFIVLGIIIVIASVVGLSALPKMLKRG